MCEDNLQNQILVHCSIICTYFIGTIIYYNFSEKLGNFELYKLMCVLLTLICIEFVNFFFKSQVHHLYVESNMFKNSSKTSLKSLKNIRKTIIAIIGVTIIYHITIVLYGAPVLTHCEKTLMLAITLTSLTLTPAILHLGIDNALYLFTDSKISVQGIIVNAVKLNIKTVLLTTWLSAFVLPLDWDRPWQIWPIPNIIGALLGYFIAHFINFIKIVLNKFGKQKRINETFKIC